ncbi:acyltransferase family protein [Allohahella marinimesophila]|uniref:acyltransferase family protein n=1 Tax=Allohahella marinimesophila TaxID=1054972 RepID=UPI0031DB12B7
MSESSARESAGSYFPHIDGLRALAVLSVLLAHVDVAFLAGGYVGVDVFFVISGFLITRMIVNEVQTSGTFRFGRFYVRRIRRLLPALLVVLAITTVIAAVIYSPAHLYSYGAELASALFSVSNFYYLAEADYFASAAQLKPLLHTWSLSVEEQFYLLWPLTLVLLLHARTRRYLPLILLALIACGLYLNAKFSDGSVYLVRAISPALAEYINDGKTSTYFLLPFRVYEFAIGALLVFIASARPPRQLVDDALALIGLALIVFSLLSFDEHMLFPSWYALLPCIGTALVIHSGGRSRLALVLTNPAAVYVGLVSYSLYLVHWPLIAFWRYLHPGADLDLLDQTGLIAVSFVLAHILHMQVEKPARYSSLLQRPRMLLSGVSLVVTLFAVTGLHMMYSGGWGWRVTPIYQLDFQTAASVHPGEPEADLHLRFGREGYGGHTYPFYGPVSEGMTPDIVVIGDSHARHYAEGLQAGIAEPSKIGLYMAAGISCLHLPSFTRTTAGRDWDGMCPASLDRALAYIGKAPRPPLVIVSHSWLWQLQQADRLDAQGARLNEKLAENALFDGILALKRLIGASQLVVIGNVPTTGVDVDLIDAFTRPQLDLFPQRDPESYVATARQHPKLARLQAFNRKLRTLSVSTGAFEFYDPFDALCDQNTCTNVTADRQLVYSDGSHLSKFGSRMVVEGLKAAIELPAAPTAETIARQAGL